MKKFLFYFGLSIVLTFANLVYAEEVKTVQDYLYIIDKAYMRGYPSVMERNWKKLCQLDQEYCNANYSTYMDKLDIATQRSAQRWRAVVTTMAQQNYQQQQLNLQQTQIMMQSMPRWDANAYTPKTYNVNLNHRIKYGSF